MRWLPDTVKKFRSDLKMNFGLSKCAVHDFVKNQIEHLDNFVSKYQQAIKSLEPGDTYKYIAMGVDQGYNSLKFKAQKIHFSDKDDACLKSACKE